MQSQRGGARGACHNFEVGTQTRGSRCLCKRLSVSEYLLENTRKRVAGASPAPRQVHEPLVPHGHSSAQCNAALSSRASR